MAWSHVLLLSSLVLCAAPRAPAQQDSQPARVRLFDAPEALPLTLTADFNALSKDRGETKQEHAGVLAFVGPAGDSVALDVRLRTRGHFRLQRRNCDFPPLKLSFDKQQVKHTVFAGQGSLKLVVHCQDRDSYEQNLLQEYLLYRVFNLITEKSFRARLARVTYLDRSGKAKPVTRYAFFIEDDDGKDSIYALFRSQEGLDPKHAEQTLRYFDEFYRTINDSRAANREFVRNCVHP